MTHEQFYKFTREQIEHEDQLLNHRTTWLLVLQGLLFSAYSLSITAEVIARGNQDTTFTELQPLLDTVRRCLAISGVISSICISIGILAAYLSIYDLVGQWCDKVALEDREQYPQLVGKEVFGEFGGLIPILTVPLLVFPFVWNILVPSTSVCISTVVSGIVFAVFAIRHHTQKSSRQSTHNAAEHPPCKT